MFLGLSLKRKEFPGTDLFIIRKDCGDNEPVCNSKPECVWCPNQPNGAPWCQFKYQCEQGDDVEGSKNDLISIDATIRLCFQSSRV